MAVDVRVHVYVCVMRMLRPCASNASVYLYALFYTRGSLCVRLCVYV